MEILVLLFCIKTFFLKAPLVAPASWSTGKDSQQSLGTEAGVLHPTSLFT